MNKAKFMKKALEQIGLQLDSLKPNKRVREGFSHKLIKSKRCNIEQAKYEVYTAKKEMVYEVITINWSFANKKEDEDYDSSQPSPNCDEVFKNTYHLTLTELFNFKKKVNQVAEDIISIKLISETNDYGKGKE